MILASVIIPCWGDRNLLDKCLAALGANTDVSGGRIETICVDNGMGWDIDADAVVHNPENKGYAAACNQGANIARSDLLCLLNMDTEVQPGWLPPMLAALEDPVVAACGPRIVHPDGSVQTSGGLRTWHGGGCAGGEELRTEGPSCDTDGVTGACMLIRKDVYESLGGMYEGYWCGAEDVDLCLTMREAGHRIRYVAESQIIHHEGASGQARWVRVHENVALINQRWSNR